MTRNQIEFLKHLETKRSNQAVEIETSRANREKERQGQLSLDETSRHNLASEQHNANVLLEQTRHNQVTEAEASRHNYATELLTSTQLQETARANRAREELTAAANAETQRANLARESETSRANRALEQWRSDSLDETYRHNRAAEKLQRQGLDETKRANLAREDISYSQLEETHRSNTASERLRERQQSESERYNAAQEQLRQRELEERERANRANELLSGARNVTDAGRLAETVYHNRKQEAENLRHNLAWEAIMATKDFKTSIDVGGTNVTVPPINVNASNPVEISLGNGTRALTDGKPAATPKGNGSNSRNEPNLVSRKVTKAYEGVIGEVANSVTGNSVQYVTERYSDGSIKYYQEEIRHGKTISRKKISEQEFKRGTRG